MFGAIFWRWFPTADVIYFGPGVPSSQNTTTRLFPQEQLTVSKTVASDSNLSAFDIAALLRRIKLGDGAARGLLVELLAKECRSRTEGRRYFPISVVREACRRHLEDLNGEELNLDQIDTLTFYEVFSDAILSAMAGSAVAEVSRLGRVLQEAVLHMEHADRTQALLLRLQYVAGLNWEEIRSFPSAAALIPSPDKAFLALGAELQRRGLSPEILVQQNLRPRGEVTHLLEDVRDGNRALGEVVAHERQRLQRQAEFLLRREGGNISLEAGDLVNEMFLRMPKDREKSPANHMEFEALAKRIMRHVLIDRARKPIPGQSRYSEELLEDSSVTASLEAEVEWKDVMNTVAEVIEELRKSDPETAAMLRATLYTDTDQKELSRLYGVSVSTVKRRVKEGRDKIRTRLGLEEKR